MAQVDTDPTTQNVTLTVDQNEAAAIGNIVKEHLPFVQEASKWLGDAAPELRAAGTFLESLVNGQGGTLPLTQDQAGYLGKTLNAHVPALQEALKVVDSPLGESILSIAKALI